MPAPTDINSQIALRKGWTWRERWEWSADSYRREGVAGSIKIQTHWRNPEGQPAVRPDFVGTLEGVSEMMRELQDKEATTSHDWMIRWSTFLQVWDVWKEDGPTRERFAQFLSTKDKGFGVAVGEAYISVFGKEAADA